MGVRFKSTTDRALLTAPHYRKRRDKNKNAPHRTVKALKIKNEWKITRDAARPADGERLALGGRTAARVVPPGAKIAAGARQGRPDALQGSLRS